MLSRDRFYICAFKTVKPALFLVVITRMSHLRCYSSEVPGYHVLSVCLSLVNFTDLMSTLSSWE